MRRGWTLLGIVATTAVLAGLVVLYATVFLAAAPRTVEAASSNGAARLTLQTVAAYGHSPDPDWVTYMAQDPSGNWHHSTIFKVPANTVVTMTILQYDTATGLRNPFFAQVRGTQGNSMSLNGKSLSVINPDDASHTFTIPDMGVSVPLPGVDMNAPNQCSAAPCTLAEAHNTITFSFFTGPPGTHRFQCFVPCAASLVFGNGGPMQTIGWMSGVVKVV